MTVRSPARVHYPESDGKPLGETEAHWICTAELGLALRAHFDDRPDVWVGSDQMLYYVEGDPKRVTSPDVYVVFGRPKLPLRRVYLLWEEGAPTVVFEITSRKTRREDLVTKRALYERLGVREYFMFDPLGEYLDPRLQGLAIGPAGYEPIEPDPGGRLPSAALGLEMEPRGHELALYEPAAGRWLPTRREAEAEISRLRAEVERLKAGDS